MPKQETCKRGHFFTQENTYRAKNGSRHCKTCRKERMQQLREGTQRGYANSRKTHCAKGHSYNEENTLHYTGSNGRPRRGCRACAQLNAAHQRVRKYGLSLADFDQLLISHNNSCGICKELFVKSPHIDHDHATGAVRGVLCFQCNALLGTAKDNVETLKAAIEYLEKFSNTESE